MSAIVSANNIAVDNIYKLTDRHTWSLDFYNKRPVGKLALSELGEHQDIWLYVTEDELSTLTERGFDWDDQYVVDHFRITRLQAKFLNPATRAEKLDKMYLIHLY